MSLKLETIYNYGGGGRGYKDGGELVDGDFIKVENNTASSYNNVSRDPINFYFEVKEGEIIDSIIELTTTINSNIKVYILKNGFYYPLGNIGGITVNASEIYKINIIDESYKIEKVDDADNDPEWYDLNGVKYPLVKIANLLWIAADVNINPVSGYPFHVIKNQTSSQYPGYFYSNSRDNVTNIMKYINHFAPGWRIPTYTDWGLLFTDVNSYDPLVSLGFPNFPNANNNTGFSALPGGRMSAGNVYQRGSLCTYVSDYRSNNLNCHADITNSSVTQTPNSQDCYLRLCKDL